MSGGSGPMPPRSCPECGDQITVMSFVDYEPAPNKLQRRKDWADDLPTVKVVICTNCRRALAAADPSQDEEHESPGGTPPAGSFRVDDDLR